MRARTAVGRGKTVFMAAVGAGLMLAAGLASAADYPEKPVRMVIGFAAGGATDLLGRIVGQKLADRLGQPFVADNRVGAGGMLATEIVAKAPGDGYTLLVASASHAINASLYKSLPYDPVADFEPVSLIGITSNVVAIHPSVPANTLAEFIALAKARPGTINLASAGSGSSSHLAGELFRSMAGINLVHVPYKGTADSLRDLLSGQVQATVDSVPALLPHINRGALRALGVGDKKRIPQLPDVPTIAEAGVPGFDAASWQMITAPAKTPREVINKLNGEIAAVLKMPDVQKRFNDIAANTSGCTPEEYSALIRSEIAKFANIVKMAGVKVQ